MKRLFLPLLFTFLGILSIAWFGPGDVGVDWRQANNIDIGINRNATITSSIPITIFGRIDNPTYGVAKYQLQIFQDTNKDGFPTAADNSSWKIISTVNNWDVPTAGQLFAKNILTSRMMVPGTNYIVRIWAENSLGQKSSVVETNYWSSQAEAQAANWRSNSWSAIYIKDIKPN